MKVDAFEQLDQVLGLLDHRPRGIVTDVDGTISEIAPSPEAAVVSAAFKKHLHTLTQRFDLVGAISGRSVEDVRRLVGVDGLVYYGNHGMEWWVDGRGHFSQGVEPYVHIVHSALDEIRGHLTVNGVIVENKGATASIHFRQAADAPSARQAILAAIRSSPSAQALRVFEGKMVVELRPPLHLHKGQALTSLVSQYGLRSLIYLGDDSTDVDAFDAVCKMRNEGRIDGLSVAVLGPETPVEVIEHADAALSGVAEAEAFFEWLTRELRK